MKYLSLLLCVTVICSCQTLDSFKDDLSDLTTGNVTTARIIESKSEILLQSPCPQVEIVDDLSSISDFTNPNKTSKENLISRVDLKSAESTCKLGSKSAIVDLKLIFNGTLGSKGRKKSSDKPFFSYPYFVAVTTPSGKIMAKEIFAASLTYGANQNKHSYFENLRQIIPIRSKAMANHYKILIGFQVTPDQLAYNREHMVSVADARAAREAKKQKEEAK